MQLVLAEPALLETSSRLRRESNHCMGSHTHKPMQIFVSRQGQDYIVVEENYPFKGPRDIYARHGVRVNSFTGIVTPAS